MDNYPKTVKRVEFGLLALLGLLSGVPYALTKVSLTTIPPITMVAARVSLAAIALWIVVFSLKCKWPKRSNFMMRLFVQSCLSCMVPYTLLAFGQRSEDSSIAAILNSLTPLFVYLFAITWTTKEAVTCRQLFGIFAGLAGAVMITGGGELAKFGQFTFGQAAIILATATTAVGAIHGRRFDDVAPEITAAGTLTFSALVLVPLCLIVEAPLRSAPSPGSVAALLINAMLATALGSILYFRLVRTIGSISTASAGYLKPAVGVLVGCALMGESLTWSVAMGLIALLVGVAAINQGGSSRFAFWRSAQVWNARTCAR